MRAVDSSLAKGYEGGLVGERKIEDEVAHVIAHAREETEPHAAMMSDVQVERRLVEIEAGLLALSSHVDEAFAEIEKLKQIR